MSTTRQVTATDKTPMSNLKRKPLPLEDKSENNQPKDKEEEWIEYKNGILINNEAFKKGFLVVKSESEADNESLSTLVSFLYIKEKKFIFCNGEKEKKISFFNKSDRIAAYESKAIKLLKEITEDPVVLLMSINSEEVDLAKLQEISTKNGGLPLLLNISQRKKRKICMYGFSENQWKLTELENFNYFSHLQFPIEDITPLGKSNISVYMQKEILSKKAHTRPELFEVSTGLPEIKAEFLEENVKKERKPCITTDKRDEVYSFHKITDEADFSETAMCIFPWETSGRSNTKKNYLEGPEVFVTAGCLIGSGLEGVDNLQCHFSLIKHNIAFHIGQKITTINLSNSDEWSPYETMLFIELKKQAQFIKKYANKKSGKPILFYHLPAFDYMLFAIELYMREIMTIKALSQFIKIIWLQKRKHEKKIKEICDAHDINVIIMSPFEYIFKDIQFDSLQNNNKNRKHRPNNELEITNQIISLFENKAFIKKCFELLLNPSNNYDEKPNNELTKFSRKEIRLIKNLVERAKKEKTFFSISYLYDNVKKLFQETDEDDLNVLASIYNKALDAKTDESIHEFLKFIENKKIHREALLKKIWADFLTPLEGKIATLNKLDEIARLSLDKNSIDFFYKSVLQQCENIPKEEKIILESCYQEAIKESNSKEITQLWLKKLWDQVTPYIVSIEELFKIANSVVIGFSTYRQEDYDTCSLLPVPEKQIQVNYDKLRKSQADPSLYPGVLAITFFPHLVCYSAKNMGLPFYFRDPTNILNILIEELSNDANSNMINYLTGSKTSPINLIDKLKQPLELLEEEGPDLKLTFRK